MLAVLRGSRQLCKKNPIASTGPHGAAFSRAVGSGGDVGIWHETYRVQPGTMHLQQHAGVRIRQGNEARPSPESSRYCRGTNESKGEISGRRVVCPYSWCHQSKKVPCFRICFDLRLGCARAEETHPNHCSSESLPVMHTAVHNLVAQGLVCTLGQFIVDNGIGSHFEAPVTACPILRLRKQLLAYSAVAVILANIPTFDVAHCL